MNRNHAVVIAAAALLLLAGCASKPTTPTQLQQAQPAKQQEASPQVRAQLHTDLGTGYYERGQLDVALEELNKAIGLDPNYAQAYNILGLIYTVFGDNRKAEQNFERALQLAPNDPQIHHNWGAYLCTHGRERESLAQFEAAVADPLYKTPETAMVNAGRCAQSIGDVRAAENYFRRALQYQPTNAYANYGLALIAYREGRYEEARRYTRVATQSTNPSAESLYLGLCVERKLHDRAAELSYVSQLRNRYPEAVETKAIDADSCP